VVIVLMDLFLAVELMMPGRAHSNTCGLRRRLTSKSNCRDDTERDEQRQRDDLRDQKRRLGLRRRQRCQDRYLLKTLRNQDEEIEIERDHGTDDIYPTPGPRKIPT